MRDVLVSTCRYPFVEFTVGLRRRYTFYMMNIILPCSLLSVLVMVVFCLPPDAGEKISLATAMLKPSMYKYKCMSNHLHLTYMYMCM